MSLTNTTNFPSKKLSKQDRQRLNKMSKSLLMKQPKVVVPQQIKVITQDNMVQTSIIKRIGINEEDSILLERHLTIDELITFCIKNNIMIFGSYVRDYICSFTFDHTISDIDIFSNISIEKTLLLFKLTGLSLNIDNSKVVGDEYFGIDAKGFNVGHYYICLGSNKICIDLVTSNKETYIYPPFNVLDFECNAFVWDTNGIKIGSHTGSYLDTLSSVELKEKELEIIDNAKKKITNYVKFIHSGDPLYTTYWLKSRVHRILKMLSRGWTINGLTFLTYCNENENVICYICNQSIIGNSFKTTCCHAIYHSDCYARFSCQNIVTHTSTNISCKKLCASFQL